MDTREIAPNGEGQLVADLVLHRLNLLGIQSSGRQSEIGKLDVTRSVDQEVLPKSGRNISANNVNGNKFDLPLASDLGGCNRVCATR
jgi:hypothetical protein